MESCSIIRIEILHNYINNLEHQCISHNIIKFGIFRAMYLRTIIVCTYVVESSQGTTDGRRKRSYSGDDGMYVIIINVIELNKQSALLFMYKL